MTNKEIILASTSPRRKELLIGLGLKFRIIPSEVEEVIDEDNFSPKTIEKLALEKVEDVVKRVDTAAVVIGADTVVVIEGKVLGKPRDKQEAFEMLSILSGNTHEVITAIAIWDTATGKVVTDHVISEVTFRQIPSDEIHRYIETGEPMDKAGSYAIQGIGSIFIKSINGCYTNVIGLSLNKLADMLKEFDICIL